MDRPFRQIQGLFSLAALLVSVSACGGTGGSGGATAVPHVAAAVARAIPLPVPSLAQSVRPKDASTMVDWPTYAFDAQRSGYNPATSAFTPSGLGALHEAWYATLYSGSQSQPIVATNVAGHAALLIVGAGNGSEQAFDGLTGKRVWSTFLGTQNDGACGTGGPAGTAQYDAAGGAIFAVSGNSGTPNNVVLYRLDVASGNVTGFVNVSTLLPGETTYAHTAITLANGLLYFGTSSNCEAASWRGQVVAVDPASLAVVGRFFPAYSKKHPIGGGGVWAWGGVSADTLGNIYLGSGNAETTDTVDSGTIQAPFIAAENEHGAYAEHLVKLSGDLGTVEDSQYPSFDFAVGDKDLDYTGTPVIFQQPGCDVMSATQGKGGKLVINDTTNLRSHPYHYLFSTPSALANYVGNPAWSPVNNYLYVAIASGTGTLAPPGLAAIKWCGQQIAWTTAFGPDSFAYGARGATPRSAPTVTAGGVVFAASPCTPNNAGGCGTPGALAGAVWAIDGVSGAVLAGGRPVLITGDNVRMAPTVDGLWMWVLDDSGNFYGMTLDPSVPTLATEPVPRTGLRSIRWRS